MTKYASQEAYEAALGNPNSLENLPFRVDPSSQNKPLGGQGIMGGQGIRQYLTPFLQQIKQRNQAEMQEKIDPYVQEVQQLTDQTFPDLNLSGGGLRGGLGSLFGGGMGGPAVDRYSSFDFMTPNMGNIFDLMNPSYQMQGGLDPMSQNQVSKPMQSSPNQNPSPFGGSMNPF